VRHRTESVIVGMVTLAGVAFGLGRALGRRAHVAVNDGAESSSSAEGSADDPSIQLVSLEYSSDGFATGYQTLVSIIEGVAFGALIVTGQNVVFRAGPVSYHFIASGQLIVTFAAIVAATEEYLQLVRAVQWSPSPIDTAVPYLLGVGQVGMATSLGSNSRWWGSVAVLSLFSSLAFSYSSTRAADARFEGGQPHREKFVSVVKSFSAASAVSFIYAVTICVLAVAHRGPGWLFIVAVLAVLPIFIGAFTFSLRLAKSG
jgi:hypothetical protein